MNSNAYSASSEARPIQCPLCQRAFTRQEHLSRHLRSHNAEKPFHCLQCNKSFSRLDVLHRHNQSHNYKRRASVGRGGSSSRACKECASSRVRCSRGSPCDRCAEKRTQCEYPAARKRKRQANWSSNGPQTEEVERTFHPTADVRSFQLHSSQHLLTNSMLPALAPALSMPGGNPETQTSNPSMAQEWLALQGPGILPSASPGVGSAGILPFENPTLADDLGEFVGNMTSVNWLSPEGFPLFPEEQLEGLLLPEAREADNTERLGEQPFQPVRPADQDSADPPEASAPPRPRARTRTPSMAVLSTSAETTTHTPTTRTSDGAYYVGGSGGRAPFKGRSCWRARTGPRWSIAPPSAELAMPESQRTGSTRCNFVSETLYQNCHQCLAAESSQFGLGIDMTILPSLGEIQDLVQLYFDGFHPTYPFLRKSESLFASSSHWILLLAVAATGSRYSTESRHHSLGESLVSVVDQVVSLRLKSPELEDDDQAWIPGSDSEWAGSLDLIMVQAMLLNSLSLLQCGKEQAVQHALYRRYYLTKAYHTISNLSAPRNVPSHPHGQTDAEDAFQDWLDLESLIRTEWMIWLLDCIAVYQFRCTALIHLGATKAPLPCQEELWDTASPPVAFSNSDHQSVTLLEALELLYMEKTLPPGLGSLSTTVIILAICRRNQEATMQYQTNLTHWSPGAQRQPRPPLQPIDEAWPPATPALSRWRNSACDCLDILHWNANSVVARVGGWEHPTILHLHLARLLLLAPVQHIGNLDIDSLASFTPHSSSQTAAISRYHTLRWAILDQYKARLCLVHAGALLWHVRRYSSNSFLEPFSVYTATIVIWAYSMAIRIMRSQGQGKVVIPESQPYPDAPAQQDQPPSLGHTGIDDRSSGSDTEVLVIQLDRPCDDEMVQNFVRSGNTMSARMHRVGDIREASAPKRILKQGIRLLTGTISDPDRVVPGWGVERAFANSLNSLVEFPVVA